MVQGAREWHKEEGQSIIEGEAQDLVINRVTNQRQHMKTCTVIQVAE